MTEEYRGMYPETDMSAITDRNIDEAIKALRRARLLVANGEIYHICNALSWLFDQPEAGGCDHTLKYHIRGCIERALTPMCITLEGWALDKGISTPCTPYRKIRLAWIDHMIEQLVARKEQGI